MSDLRNYSHEFISEFIALYRDNPCLWKIKSKDYSNRNKKSAAYEVLCAKLKEKDPNASKESVIKKINSLRSCFRKEMKKVRASETSGAGEEDLYKPTLWYFDQLLFLTDQKIPRESISSLEDSDDETCRSENDPNDNLSNETQNVRDTRSDTSVSQLSFRSATSSRACKKIRMNRSDEVLNLVANKSKSSDCLLYTSYGNHVAEELRALPKDQALFCQKLINDAIFEAKLGNLDRSSMVWTKNSSHEK